MLVAEEVEVAANVGACVLVAVAVAVGVRLAVVVTRAALVPEPCGEDDTARAGLYSRQREWRQACENEAHTNRDLNPAQRQTRMNAHWCLRSRTSIEGYVFFTRTGYDRMIVLKAHYRKWVGDRRASSF